jgi:hypothetical protein
MLVRVREKCDTKTNGTIAQVGYVLDILKSNRDTFNLCLEIQIPKRTQGFKGYAAGTWFILHGFTVGSRESATVKLESNDGRKFAKYLTCFEEDDSDEFPMDDDPIEEFMLDN